jgi:CHASE1-domain containing sensor protein
MPCHYLIISWYVVNARLLTMIGLVAGLTSYFLLKNNDIIAAQSALGVTATQAANQLTSAFLNAEAIILGAAALFQVSKTPVTLYDQWVPYMASQGQGLPFPKVLTIIGHHAVFPGTPEATSAFQTDMRAQGGDYVNFTVTGRDANNSIVPPVANPLRAVLVHLIPVALMKTPTLGYDVNTDPIKNSSFYRAILSGKPSTTGRVLAAALGPNDVATSIYVGLFNSTTGVATGAVSSIIVVSQLIEAVVDSLTGSIDISLIDMNSTSDDSFNGFLWSNVQTTSYIANQQHIANAQYTRVAYVPMADRTLKLILMPGSGYQDAFDLSLRYIALILSLCFSIILIIGCVVMYFSSKMIQARESRKRAFVQIDLLKTDQCALRGLLDRIASQEAKVSL